MGRISCTNWVKSKIRSLQARRTPSLRECFLKYAQSLDVNSEQRETEPWAFFGKGRKQSNKQRKMLFEFKDFLEPTSMGLTSCLLEPLTTSSPFSVDTICKYVRIAQHQGIVKGRGLSCLRPGCKVSRKIIPHLCRPARLSGLPGSCLP